MLDPRYGGRVLVGTAFPIPFLKLPLPGRAAGVKGATLVRGPLGAPEFTYAGAKKPGKSLETF